MFLDKIIKRKIDEVKKARNRVPLEELKKKTFASGNKSNFAAAISRKGRVNLIAEIKRSSPSKGIIRGNFDPVTIAWDYQQSGAGALSVLTDERYFDGHLKYIKEVKDKVDIPVLRKDFLVDEYQIYEASVAGADAVLLIARILSADDLKSYVQLSSSLGMDHIVEVHDEEDINKALEAGADVIGINNRDLTSFQVDTAITEKLSQKIPKDKIIVSESGIDTYEDIMNFKNIGINAVLIGEAFMRANDIHQKVRDIMRENV